MSDNRSPLVIGAGPAGLTAALELAKRGATPRVFEASDHVGGLARTPCLGGWRVDPGGHRFFTKSQDVLELWRSLLPAEEWVAVPRRSAMLVRGHHVRYPLVGRDLLTQLGIGSGIRGLGELALARLTRSRHHNPGTESFEDWGVSEFGRHWYRLFFEGYVRKTWLADPADLTSEWANQRIHPVRWRGVEEFTRRDVFQYPRMGPGQLWEAAATTLARAGVEVTLNAPVTGVSHDRDGWTVRLRSGETATGDAVFASMPLRSLIAVLKPEPPQRIRDAAAALKHRALITVGVAVPKRHDFPSNWLYTPGRELRVGRIQNYARWSAALSPAGPETTHWGLEYFTNAADDLWRADGDTLAKIVDADLRALGVDPSSAEQLLSVRSEFAYPVYDADREKTVAVIRDYLRQEHPSLRPMGRNGMHHYDNQDHAMLSAMGSVARYYGEDVNPWSVNTELRYQESGLLRL